VADFNEKIQEEVNKAKNLWEARKKFIELYESSEVRVMDGTKLEYGGIKLFDINSHGMVLLDSFIKSGDLELVSIDSDGYRKSYEKRKINSVYTKQSGLFYINDLATGAFVRAAKVAKDNGQQVILFRFKNAALRQQIVEHIGCDDTYFTKISTVPSPTIRKSGGSRGSIARVVSFDISRGEKCETASAFWSNEKDTNLDLGGLYVEFNRYNYRSGSSLMHPNNLARIIRMCQESGIVVPQICGIKTADIHRINKNKKWINFNVWIVNEVTKLVSSANIDEVVFYKTQLSSICKNSYNGNGRYCKKMSIEQIISIAKHCEEKGSFTAFAEVVKYAKGLVDKSEQIFALRNLANVLKVTIPTNKQGIPKFSFDKMESEVYNRYVLLGLLDTASGFTSPQLVSLGQYVDSIK
jgi:hypothetical protein